MLRLLSLVSVGADSRPGPYVTRSGRGLFGAWNVPLFGADKSPYLIDLHALAATRVVLLILEFGGGLARDEAERSAWALVSKHYRLH